MSSKFTILIDVFLNLSLFREAIEAIQNQTYKNLEIIISDNGANQNIKEFISIIEATDKRIKVLKYEKNIFSYKDVELRTFILCNDALKVAEGDYVFYQSYDDVMALDYVERMVKLFDDNSKCLSAAGLPISIDLEGNSKEAPNLRKTNIRPRYMAGHELAIDALENKVMFSAPGTIFSFRKDSLLKYGGFHRSIELSQLYGIVPFGETGFDEDAIFYWRRHEGQLNKELSKLGYCGAKELYSLLDDFNLRERWKIFGDSISYNVVSSLNSNMGRASAALTAYNLFNFNITGTRRTFIDSYSRFYYWKFLPIELWRHKLYLALSFLKIFKFIISPSINILSSLSPFIDNLSIIKKLRRFFQNDNTNNIN